MTMMLMMFKKLIMISIMKAVGDITIMIKILMRKTKLVTVMMMIGMVAAMVNVFI